jgi:monomeric sarcosine oxidase
VKHVDYMVIGLGAMGSSALYHLTQQGVQATGIEQFSVGHGAGSSHGHSRAFRTFYDKAIYTELALASIPLWRDLEAQSGKHLLYQTGMLCYAPPDHPTLMNNIRIQASVGGSHEILSPDEVNRRYPALHIPTEHIACLTHDSGFLHAGLAVKTHVVQAQESGAMVFEDTDVKNIDLSTHLPEVETSQGRYQCDHLIITAGPWAGQILHDLGVPLKVTRQQKYYFTPQDKTPFLPENLPVFADYSADLYGFPYFGGGIKTADDFLGPITDPGSTNRDIDLTSQAALKHWLEQVLPGTPWTAGEFATCLYTLTPDRDFILDRHPDHPRVLIGAGFSGHGFKFATLIGRILADLAIHERTEYPIKLFQLDRFR